MGNSPTLPSACTRSPCVARRRIARRNPICSSLAGRFTKSSVQHNRPPPPAPHPRTSRRRAPSLIRRRPRAGSEVGNRRWWCSSWCCLGFRWCSTCSDGTGCWCGNCSSWLFVSCSSGQAGWHAPTVSSPLTAARALWCFVSSLVVHGCCCCCCTLLAMIIGTPGRYIHTYMSNYYGCGRKNTKLRCTLTIC